MLLTLFYLAKIVASVGAAIMIFFGFGYLGAKYLDSVYDGITLGLMSTSLLTTIGLCYDIAKNKIERENQDLVDKLKDTK